MTSEHIEIRRKRAREWNKAHPERVRENHRRYQAENKIKIGNAKRRWSAANRDKIRAAQDRFKAAKPWYTHWIGAKMRCTNPNASRYEYYGGKGIKFLLSQEDVKFIWERDGGANMKRPSIDRIDSDKDYVLDNVRMLEMPDNSRKARLYGAARHRLATRTRGDFPILTHSDQS